ncbi:MAG: hypothetical protein M1823_005711 [Watsoniomyces obsoletus]|nr:MAG: hypothetical protein M1823_005711 [Watsoniomyces obsoletus]
MAVTHLKYTIPPAILLTFLYRPLRTILDIYKIIFLISIAVISTIPWDAYLIHQGIWSYPANVVLGPKLFDIPIEELFFFVIQTYNTTLLYLLLNKPVLHAAYLLPQASKSHRNGPTGRMSTLAGQVLLALLIAVGYRMVSEGKQGTYLGLIIIWAGPFAFMLWTLAAELIVALPLVATVMPIILPTLYLWLVDTLALRRGTWSIGHGTKLGWYIWPHLEVEEAFFFLATNVIIVLGLVTADYTLAVLDATPKVFPVVPKYPSPALLARALFLPRSQYDELRLEGIAQAAARLQGKSRSFYLASGTFGGRLRIDLVLLYAFCRVADDLIDDAPSMDDARSNLANLMTYLDLAYEGEDAQTRLKILDQWVRDEFPPDTYATLLSLPVEYLSEQPLRDLLRGFHMDLGFLAHPTNSELDGIWWPIGTEKDLEEYALCVAGTVAELCLDLVFHHSGEKVAQRQRQVAVEAGRRMGIALQLVNIARDIAVDALLERVYLPTSWLNEFDLTPDDILEAPISVKVMRLRRRLLDRAEAHYRNARPAIENLPRLGRPGMRVAVESYMEIGRVLGAATHLDARTSLHGGRASVPTLRRLRVAWRALAQS